MNRIAQGALALSASGLIMLAVHEGFSTNPYKDTGGVVTNGFGNATIAPNKPVTVLKALEDLHLNTSVAGKAVAQCVKAPMTQGQYDAYVSFAFNVGGGAFCKSTMVRKANAGDRVGSCKEFDRWVYVAGKDCRIKSSNCSGIVQRRKAERELCLQD